MLSHCHSPHGTAWRYGAPRHRVCSELTYADVVTSDGLSIMPLRVYGAMRSSAVSRQPVGNR